jgi:hypothetical protein
MSNPERKQWWAPVWTGLVADEGAKHYRKMKNSVWLFLYLLLHANRRTGVLMRKVRTISKDMGITRDTTLRWLKVLRTEGYIVTLNTGRYLTIQVQNWKGLSVPGKALPQKTKISDPSSGSFPTALGTGSSPIPVHSDPRSAVTAAANDTKIQIILNNDIRCGGRRNPVDTGFKSIGFYAKHELLAWDLAKALDDSAGIRLYRSYCRKYPEWLLRKVLGEVMEVPIEQLRKGRGALFNHLVQQYAQNTAEDPGR